tara:strand:+ start:1432 stop:3066 length:1635 start_codon:yes stop_codon:yes gene_type:complete
METKKLVQILALQNAIKYNGKADPKSTLGQILANNPNLRKEAKEIKELVEKEVKSVNKLSLKKQQEKLKILGEIKPPKKEEPRLIELKNVKGKVIVRFAPNPNGALTLGHSRQAFWNWYLTQQYKGEYILRFDDTDPKNKVPLKEAYQWIQEDHKWLGIKPDKVIIQSERLNIYYKYAEKLIKQKHAYVCTCHPERKRLLSSKQKPCPCRSTKDNLGEWKKLFGHYKEGEAVLRIKTDLDYKNPAVRDFPAFRIVDKSLHPLDKKSKVWPLLNFASAIDDHELKVTHIIRGIDLQVSDERQKYIYKYLKWKYPETVYNGKLLVSGIKSTTEASKLIKAKKLTGWDDPRLGTLQALRKRGFQPEAIKKFLLKSRLNKNDIHVSIESLEAENRLIIEPIANRYFFIQDPKKIKISGVPELISKAPLHPDDLKRGHRTHKVGEEFYIEDKLEKDKNYRLMHLLNFKNNKFLSEEYDPKLKTKQIHWIPLTEEPVQVEIVMPDNSTIKGIAEHHIKDLKENQIIQFERFGFCILNKINKVYKFYFTHK